MKDSGHADIAAISCRRMRYQRSRGLIYTFEDLGSDLGVVRLVGPASPYANKFHSGIVSRLYRHAPHAGTLLIDHRLALGTESRVQLLMVQTLTDLPLLLPYFDQKRDGRVLACFIEEIWVNEMAAAELPMQLLRQCDLIFVGCHGAVGAVAKATSRPTFHISPSIDAEESNPFSGLRKQRSIDLYYMGRRQTDLHHGLLEWSAETGSFYLYDTAGNAEMSDHREHRRHLADLIQRSRFFLVAPGKSTGAADIALLQHEVGYRYYEGAGAGAILIGMRNDSPILQQNFDYKDAVFGFDGTPGALLELMSSLATRRRDLLDTVQRQGVANILRRHDHAYRWRTILQTLQLREPPALGERIGRLQEAADQIVAAGAQGNTELMCA